MNLFTVLFVGLIAMTAQAQKIHHQRLTIDFSEYTCKVTTPTETAQLTFAEEYDELLKVEDKTGEKHYMLVSALDEGKLFIEVYDATDWVNGKSDTFTHLKSVQAELKKDLKIEFELPKPYKLKVSCPPPVSSF